MNRKIKNLIGTIILIASIFQLTSCSLKPKYTEDDDVKTFILWNCVNRNYIEELYYMWIAEVEEGKIEVSGYEKSEEENDALNLFGECCRNFVETISLISFCQHFEGAALHYDFDFDKDKDYFFETFWCHMDYWGTYYGYSVNQMKADKNKTDQIVTSLYESFHEYFKKHASAQVKMLSWEPDLMNTGDLFSGYSVTYEIGEGFYALVSLIEYDKENRYEIRLEKKGDSLIELNN